MRYKGTGNLLVKTRSGIELNVLHNTSKGMREMNYQDTQQFERATMLKLPIQHLFVLCGVTSRFLFYLFGN